MTEITVEKLKEMLIVTKSKGYVEGYNDAISQQRYIIVSIDTREAYPKRIMARHDYHIWLPGESYLVYEFNEGTYDVIKEFNIRFDEKLGRHVAHLYDHNPGYDEPRLVGVVTEDTFGRYKKFNLW